MLLQSNSCFVAVNLRKLCFSKVSKFVRNGIKSVRNFNVQNFFGKQCSIELFSKNWRKTFYSHRWLLDYARKGNYDVTIENVTDGISCLGIAGPHSRSVLSKLTSADLSHSGFKFLTFKDIELAGVPVRAMRISYTGEFSATSFVLRSWLIAGNWEENAILAERTRTESEISLAKGWQSAVFWVFQTW